MSIAELSLEDAAKAAAGNWQRFHCFVWFREKQQVDADNWSIVYTHHRDSGILDESNASVIRAKLAPFAEGQDPDVVFESHSHWAVGHVDGFSIRVLKRQRITKAFRNYFELVQQMEEYPILDESDYSDREYEETLKNIENAAWRLRREASLPDGWESEVYSWLSDNEGIEIENVDDRGGYPTEGALTRAFEALGFRN